MSRTQNHASTLADRLCRTQRIGVFGHRGVGKTTFLTMLYREAVGGRIPEMRLAAADPRTADYLADKILQLEAGQPLPATLAETDLHFHLYHRGNRLDLLLKDYQGEHVAVGREEPIRAFLRDCDAVWLCLDVTVAAASDTCLQAQQEVEQLVEDYLAAQPPATPHRPMALLLTKADLLPDEPGGLAPRSSDGTVDTFVQDRLGMTLHALLLHCPQHAILAVSSLGRPIQQETSPAFQPEPVGLAGPLQFLANSLQQQDEVRLAQIWELQPNNLPLLQRCVNCFARRYPSAPATRKYVLRLGHLRPRTQRRRLVIGASALLAFVLLLCGYDAWGRHQMHRVAEATGGDPVVLLEQWQSFQRWHPTRHLFLSDGSRRENEVLHDLEQRVRAKRCEEQLAQLQCQAEDPDASPEAVWEQFQKFREEFPERNLDAAQQELRGTLKVRRDAERERKAGLAHAELLRQEARAELPAQIARAEKFLLEFGDTEKTSEVRLRLAGYLRQFEEQTIEAARSYSSRNPFNFLTRQDNYRKYLQRYPTGAFVEEARKAVDGIGVEWDKHDFRKVRDQFQDKPGEVKELEALCRAYLTVQEQGRYRESATELLRWIERVRGENEYKVTLRSGSFDPKSVGYFSRGLNLSVDLEVNGVAYGPSTIAKRGPEPEWNYEFPRPIKWKLGDKVRIRVIDHYYWHRTILDVRSEEGDVLGMKMLSGSVLSGKHSVVFESDFGMPVLPKIE